MNKDSLMFTEPFRPWIVSLTRANQFVAEQLDSWVRYRMDSLRSYVDLGVAQTKVALKVTDLGSLREFADSQFAVASFVGHRVIDDGRLLSEWSEDCYKQANLVGRRNMLSMLFKY